MIPMFFLPPEAVALHDAPPPPFWMTLAVAGVAALATAFALAVS